MPALPLPAVVLPAERVSEPASPALVEPTLSLMEPPPVSLVPVLSVISPVGTFSVLPVPMKIEPAVPPLLTPVLSLMLPLALLEAPFGVNKVMSPVLELELDPVVIVTGPPAPPLDEPAEIVTAPPMPVVPSPTDNLISPPAPPVPVPEET